LTGLMSLILEMGFPNGILNSGRDSDIILIGLVRPIVGW
jgi:hypothetical protein